MPWSIGDKVDNIFEEGEYLLQVAAVTYGQPKEGNEHGRLMIRLKVVSKGPHEEELTTQGFPLDPKFIGILATFLHGSGDFDPQEKNMPDNEEDLTNFIRDRILGHIYTADYTVDESKGRKYGRIRLTGQYSPDA